MGGMSCLDAQPPAEWAPLMHWIDERRRENDRLHLIQAILLHYRAVPIWKRAERRASCSRRWRHSQPTSEGHDEGSEGAMLDFPNSLFVGPFS